MFKLLKFLLLNYFIVIFVVKVSVKVKTHCFYLFLQVVYLFLLHFVVCEKLLVELGNVLVVDWVQLYYVGFFL